MKKIFFLISFAIVLNSFAAESTTFCKGSSFTDDGLVYDNIMMQLRFDKAEGNFDLSADGHNDHYEYDIQNRFQNVPFVGTTTQSASGRVTSLNMSGHILPGGRGVAAIIDTSRPHTTGKLTLERSDRSLIKALLNCETQLAPKCHEVTSCHRSCHPMVGCDDEPNCQSHTVCEPREFD